MTVSRSPLLAPLAVLSLALASCSGGGSSGAAPAADYRVAARVTGLAGAGLVLHLGADDVAVPGDGTFVFPTPLAAGAAYEVTVARQPTLPWQTCAVAAGAGRIAGASVTVAVACVTNEYAIAGTVAGLSSPGLVLHCAHGAGEDLAVAGSGAFAFPTRALSGALYAVSVKAQPAGHTCAVSGGAGAVTSADVSFQVTCAPNLHAVGGAVSGLGGSGLVLHGAQGAGEDLAVAANGPFTFPTRVPWGASYAVTVKAQPAGEACVVSRGAGVVGGDVTDVAVSCGPGSFSVGGTISGLSTAGLVLHTTVGGEDLSVAAGATAFTFAGRAPPGTPYAVTVKSQPVGLECGVTGGAGVVGTTDVTGVAVRCSAVLLAWSAPERWGAVWQDGPTMVQHAWFDAGGIVSAKGPTFAMVGGAAPATKPLGGFPAPVGTRFAGGPFPQEAVNYQAADAAALDLPGDLLACAVVKPARSRPFDSYEHPILSKSLGDGKNDVPQAGWSLMQMHDSWCFHYEYKDANGDSRYFMSSIPAYFPNQDFHSVLAPPVGFPGSLGQPNPSWVVVCGGRSGDDVVVAANAWDPSSAATFSLARTMDQRSPSPYPAPYVLDAAAGAPATIGGYHRTSAALRAAYPPALLPANPDAFKGKHVFEGLVLETAVWAEPATPANVAARMRAFLGVAPGSAYLRNREAAIVGPDGKLHFAWRHGPRLDPARGQLFGFQSWNRVSYWIDGSASYPYPMVFAAGENLTLWQKVAGSGGEPTVTLDPAVTPPGDSRNPGQLVTLPAGASLAIALDPPLPPAPGLPPPIPHVRRRTWDVTGPVQGQLWLRPATGGTLRIQKTDPAPGAGGACTVLGAPATCEARDVALAALAAGAWSRVSLSGAFTADAAVDAQGVTARRGTLVLTNPGDAPLSFHAWGIQLTQLGGGYSGGFDPAELMYDWSASQLRNGEPSDDPVYPLDVLRLDPLAPSTAATGFCLAAEASTPAGLPWDAPFRSHRTAIAWLDRLSNPTKSVRIYVHGAEPDADAGELCLVVNAAAPLCAALPAPFDDGARHRVQGCMSAAGQARLYVDGQLLASGAPGVPTPDLQGGTVLVGNADLRPNANLSPWHGYVARAAVCRDTGNGDDCR